MPTTNLRAFPLTHSHRRSRTDRSVRLNHEDTESPGWPGNRSPNPRSPDQQRRHGVSGLSVYSQIHQPFDPLESNRLPELKNGTQAWRSNAASSLAGRTQSTVIRRRSRRNVTADENDYDENHLANPALGDALNSESVRVSKAAPSLEHAIC